MWNVKVGECGASIEDENGVEFVAADTVKSAEQPLEGQEVLRRLYVMAAAPELCEALEQIIPFVDGGFEGAIPRIKAARTAIAKAKGCWARKDRSY
jgi:hypothetical protein